MLAIARWKAGRNNFNSVCVPLLKSVAANQCSCITGYTAGMHGSGAMPSLRLSLSASDINLDS